MKTDFLALTGYYSFVNYYDCFLDVSNLNLTYESDSLFGDYVV